MYRCPECHQPLNASLACPQGHQFAMEDGLLVLLRPDFRRQLEAFLARFAALRQSEGRRILDPAVYPTLPYNPALQSNPEWRLRRYDAELILGQLTGRSPLRILDLGAWNGWLSHLLAAAGHQVTAVDYFSDAYDGLRARRHYPAGITWHTIQLDLRDLTPLAEPFDLIIVNRCLQFFIDPPAYLAEVQKVVAHPGRVLYTGLSFFRDPRAKARSVAAFHQHLAQHDLVNFKPMKGYLDFHDKARLTAAGVRLHPYPQLRRANLKSYLLPTAPRYYYGIQAV